MKRRNFLRLSALISSMGVMPMKSMAIQNENRFNSNHTNENDRAYWVHLLNKIATPVLQNMSNGTLRKNMKVAFSPTWDNRNKEVAYMEAFGRLLVGIAPFLNLKNEEGCSQEEKNIRKKITAQTLQSLKAAVDTNSNDYLLWSFNDTKQTLVDAAFMAQALLSAPDTLWYPLDTPTKEAYIKEFTKLRQIEPPNNNWVLFAAIIESFLLFIGESYSAERIEMAIDKIKSWYVGDGWYADGTKFHFDYYNGYVIHPMFTEVLRINVLKNRIDKKEWELAYKRMQRFAFSQERMISPEGTYPVIGRSSTYRAGAFQPLAKLALDNQLPESLEPAQIRSALTAVLKNIFMDTTFDKEGWLTLGLVGNQQENIADSYSNTGSMYLTSFVFLPLGLSPENDFWKKPFADWTQRKAWSGKPFKKDYAVDY